MDIPPRNTRKGKGVATEFEASTYDISNLQYPDNLYSATENVYGNNFVVFYINVASDAKLDYGKGKDTIVTKEIPPRMRGDNIGQRLDSPAGGGFVAGAVTGATLSGVIGLISGGKGRRDFVGKAKDTLTAGAIGAAAAAVVNTASGGKMSRQQKRLESAIALHVPNSLSIRYSTSWQDDETLAWQAANIGSEEIMKAVANVAGGNLPSSGLDAAGNFATNIVLSKTPFIAGGLSSSSGLAANPKKEQLFKNVNYREFSFDYTFSPRSKHEAENVLEIIKKFKFHMHPNFKDDNNFVFVYPSEFDIYYYQNGRENMNLHRHTSCVLKDMIVNYTPNGTFNTFGDGMPTQINVTLTFLELAILTKQQIDDNF